MTRRSNRHVVSVKVRGYTVPGTKGAQITNVTIRLQNLTEIQAAEVLIHAADRIINGKTYATAAEINDGQGPTKREG